MENSIEIKGLTKKYGEFAAVDQLNLTIGEGEVFGLLGPNGAGKSTTILMLMGLTEPSAGSIRVCGIDPVKQPIAVKKKVGYLPEDVGFYDDQTGLENLVYTGRLNGLTRMDAYNKAEVLLKKVGLVAAADKRTSTYSRGMRQRLGLADVLIKSPEIIILDEPTLGIDPTGVKEFLDLIIELSRKDGITVVFSSHHLHQVQQVCDRVGIFVQGKLLAEGNINDLARKLFSSGSTTITGELQKSEIRSAVSVKKLEQMLSELPEVTKAVVKDGQFDIEANTDLAASISELIVQAGYGVTQLNRKVYGLDDIYYRYFQGLEN